MNESVDFPVLVIDDDDAFTDSLKHLLEVHNILAHTFPDAEAFLARKDATPRPAIALVDVRMPGKTGIDLLSDVVSDPLLVVVMMTGHGNVPLAVRAIQKGALEFLEKPFAEAKLLASLRIAQDELRRRVEEWNNRRSQTEKLAQLSRREKAVLELVSQGRNTKQIAEELKLSGRTVEMHRANLLRRLDLRTMAEALALLLDVQHSG